MALDDETLREAANHRGLKLVKSRKRKPGVGDFGHFGLIDAAGKPLFGIDDGTLTATAQEIADYLRKGEASTWAESAKTTPPRAKRAEPDEPDEDAAEDDSAAPPAIRPRATKSTRASALARRERTHEALRPPSASRPRTDHPEPTPEPQPQPELTIRPARQADADGVRDLLALIGFDGTSRDVARALASAAARQEAVLVADRGGVIGCLAWHVIPAFQHGPIARITALVVAENARRSGIGRALFDAATDEFARHHVEHVEAMSAIAVRNANGFYRALGLEQRSYRFLRAL